MLGVTRWQHSSRTDGEVFILTDFRRFLECLEENRSDAVGVAQCFVKNIEKFVIYANYCTNYPRLDIHHPYITYLWYY